MIRAANGLETMTNVFPPFDPERTSKPKRKPVFPRGKVPVRILFPTIITLLALCAGLTAIRMAIELRYEWAIAALVLAAVLDALDGLVARALKASSRFGAELDSLADFVNFGVAPAIIIFTWALGDTKAGGWIVVMIFAVCMALRLARFNVSLDEADRPAWKSSYFQGVPAPAGAILVLLPLYLEGLGVSTTLMPTPVVLAYTLAVSFLVVSTIPTYSSKLFSQRVSREYFLPVSVLTVLAAAVLLTYPYATLTIGCVGYFATMLLSTFTYRKEMQKAAETAKAQNGSSKKAQEAKPPAPEPLRRQAR